MGELEKIQQKLSPQLDSVNNTIKESLHASNKLLSDIIDFFLNRRGKQIRPIFTLLIAQLLGEPNSKTINGAAAIELLHNASLIHDDVVDNSEMRRSVETINKIWDNQIAVLVGDFFVTSALDRALATRNIDIVGNISELGRKLAIGELDQIYNAQQNLLSEEAYIKMIELKTASLFIASARIAALSVDASVEDMEIVAEFARLLGICFQIKDDTFDYLEDSTGQIGKPVEADLLERKISLPLLHVLIEDRSKGNEEYIGLCFDDNISDATISKLVKYACDNGGIEYARNYMEQLYRRASSLIQKFSKKDVTALLDSLFRYVIERDH